PTFVYRHLLGFAATLTFTQVVTLAKLDEVRQVEWAQPGEAELNTATVSFGARAVQDGLQVTGDVDGILAQLSLADIGVAILDTGMDGQHVDLAGRFVVFVDAQDQKIKEPYDSGNHGTHVASIVGGLGAGDAKYRGVAPGAALIGIKIASPAGSKEGALFGMDWIINHTSHYNIRVSTISFGFGATVDGTDALELAMDRAFEAGILPFKSAGNSGPEAGTITIPGGARGIVAVGSMLDPGGQQLAPLPVSVPGAADNVVPSNEYGFHLSGYSSRGPTQDGRIKPDLVAPGQSVTAASNGTGNGYITMSGTSMASPFAAGVAALVLAADPELSPAQVRDVMASTTDDWGPEGVDIDYGAGRLNALLAVQTALRNRLLRDGASFEALEAVANVTNPGIPFHAGGMLSGNTPMKVFIVEEAGVPIAITSIVNATVRPPLPGGLPAQPPAVPRTYALAVQGPDDPAPIRLSPGTTRQTINTFMPTSAGEHTIRLVNAAPNSEVVYDVSAGIPPPEDILALGIPQSGEYEVVGRGELAAGPQTVPGVGLVFAAVAALAGAFVARRRA
ncbi:MAG TPA: S8 family serine peptidase, partial [Candidatus Thermoplasmatota archaeon]